MKLSGAIFVATLSVLATGASVAAPLAPAQVEQHIRQLQQDWMQAWVRQDKAALEELLAPDYALTVSSLPDRPFSRQEWLGMLDRYTAQGFEYRDMRVRLFGDIAVVTSIGRTIGARVDGNDRSKTFFLTDIWRRTGDRWQVAARHSSIPEGDSDAVRAMRSRPEAK